MKESIIRHIENQSEIIKNARSAKNNLENQLKDLLINESGLKRNVQYLDAKNVKIWIDRFELKEWFNKYSIVAITYKVKKDGTNGLQSHNSWGYNIENIKRIKEL